jgi:hypothetical protein
MTTLLNQTLGNRTTAVYGDANVQAATIVPNLNNVSDGVNLNVISDSGQFNLYQALTINDNFYDTRTEEVYQTVVSSNIVAIQGALMGWVNKKDMVLCVQTLISTNTLRALAVNDWLTNLTQWSQPSFALLQPLVRVEIRLGNNNQIVQRNMMNYMEGIRMIAMDKQYSWAERNLAAQLGLPYSVLYSNMDITALTANRTVYPEVDSIFIARYSQMRQMLLNVAPGTGVLVELSIPLGMVNGFFQEDAFLPPGLPFRIEIEYNASTGIPVASAFSSGAALLPTNIVQQWQQNMSFRYRSHILKAHIQDSINNEWITKPFLYQYDTFEFVEIVGDGATITLLKDIAINQQRPTQLYFRVLPTNGTPTYTLQNSTAGIDSTGDNYWALEAGNTEWGNADAGPWRIRNLFIYIGGRQNYYLRMDATGNLSGPFQNGGAAGVNELVNGRVYHSEGLTQLTSFSEPTGFFHSKPFCVSINPGDFVKRGYISSDSGALVIRVQMDVVWNPCTTSVGNPANVNIALPNTYKLVIYKKYPEQIQINAAKNLNIISWPAVAASNNYLIPSTYNMN